MISYPEFSALRIHTLFPDAPEVLRDREMFGGPPCHDSFDWEYCGGLWCQESVEGVSLLFPEVEPDLVGAVELMPSSPGTDAEAHARSLLERLGLSVRFGVDAAAVRRLAGGRAVEVRRNEAARLAGLSFTYGQTEPYHLEAIVSDEDGLVSLEIRRLDLVEANWLEEDEEDEEDEDRDTAGE